MGGEDVPFDGGCGLVRDGGESVDVDGSLVAGGEDPRFLGGGESVGGSGELDGGDGESVNGELHCDGGGSVGDDRLVGGDADPVVGGGCSLLPVRGGVMPVVGDEKPPVAGDGAAVGSDAGSLLVGAVGSLGVGEGYSAGADAAMLGTGRIAGESEAAELVSAGCIAATS